MHNTEYTKQAMELNQQPRRGKTGAVKHLYANAVDKLTSPKPEIKKLRKDFMSIMEHMVLTSPVMQDKQNVRKDTYSIFPQLFIRPDSLVQLFYLQSNASSLCLLPSTPMTTTLLDSIVIKVFINFYRSFVAVTNLVLGTRFYIPRESYTKYSFRKKKKKQLSGLESIEIALFPHKPLQNTKVS